ncbi:MAG TPA: cation:dicarboxylase symporter family transporter [Candidatus Dependentiae bacterium]|nr:cation:dicarboxylase symporter family transporter [Candidatus Dependentiae bacterium]HRQ62230.1 cation:dicarboxylase symporter family transporter [Candidatus Dependentiae bacterium]
MIKRISLPIQLLCVIGFVFLFGGMLSTYTAQFFYTFSVWFKDALSFLLPFIVFSFVLTGILSFKKNAPVVLLVMLALIFCSNALVALLSYVVIRGLLPLGICSVDPAAMLSADVTIDPLYVLSLPLALSSEYAMLAAVGFGLLFSFFPWPWFEQQVIRLKELIEAILNIVIIPLLPLYVFGFLLKIQHEGMFMQLIQQYGSTVFILVAMQISYLVWIYFVAVGFSLPRALRAINIALPSYLTAFSTMSSTATVPVSVATATKNTGDRALAGMAMPIMANVHLLGDAIGVPVLAMVTMTLYQVCLPSLSAFMHFVFYFCLSMFAVSGIPGGGIIVISPILKTVFGFTPEMVSIIITLYLLLDSFGTAANVMGDGALVIIVQKVLKKLKIVT